MPKKFIKREKERNKDKNGASGTTNIPSSSGNSGNAIPDEIRNCIKTNSIKLDSVKSKQDVVMKGVENIHYDVMLMKDQVYQTAPNLSKCDELKKIQSEYIENQADLSNQLRLINRRLAQKESLIKSLNTQITSLKMELFLPAQKDSENQCMGVEELKAMIKDKESLTKSFNSEFESLKRELHVKSQQDAEKQCMLMEELKLNNRKDVQISDYTALFITLITASYVFGVKEVLFFIALYFLVQYFIQKLRKYISSLLAKFVAYPVTLFP